MTISSSAAMSASPSSSSGVAVLNGPEDDPTDWLSIDWQAVEEDVRRLQRIFTATQAGDLKRVRNLQKLMLRSRANTLLSVRRVTENNAGRKTAGIDGEVVLLPRSKAELADWVQHQSEPWLARPVKRVYIPKAGGKRRPLGIPPLRRRSAQYWVRAGSSGDDRPLTRVCRTIFVQANFARCPACQGLLLHADRPPQSPREWEQWLATTRKAVAKSYLTEREDGTPDENKPRLIHAQCQR